MASIWGGDDPSVAWGINSWQSNTITISLTGLNITSELNADGVNSFPEQGWGSDTWGYENWGASGFTVEVSGVEFSSVIGENGWCTIAYGEGAWGEWVLIPADVVGLTGVSFGSALGTSSVQVDYTDAPSGYAVATEQGTGWTININYFHFLFFEIMFLLRE